MRPGVEIKIVLTGLEEGAVVSGYCSKSSTGSSPICGELTNFMQVCLYTCGALNCYKQMTISQLMVKHY